MRKKIGMCIAAVALAGTVAVGCVGCAKEGVSGTGNNNNTTSGGGHPAMDLVAGGAWMTSPNYRMVLTTGQGPGGNGVMTSPSFRLYGGVVGATQ